MKRKLHKNCPYSRISVLSVDMSNPTNVFYFSRRIRSLIKRIDVLYLNNSVVNIKSMDWNVMYDTLRCQSIGYFFTTGRYSLHLLLTPRDKTHDHYMITPVNLGVNDFGLSSEFCQQVLSPFILVWLLFPFNNRSRN